MSKRTFEGKSASYIANAIIYGPCYQENKSKRAGIDLNIPTVFRKYNELNYTPVKRISASVNATVKKIPTHYEILNIDEDACGDAIECAFKLRLEKLKNVNASLTELKQAYKVLSESKQRQDYDELLKQERSKRLVDVIPHRHVSYKVKNTVREHINIVRPGNNKIKPTILTCNSSDAPTASSSKENDWIVPTLILSFIVLVVFYIGELSTKL